MPATSNQPVTPELLEYIKQRRSAGASDEMIRSELVAVRWPEASITQGLAAVTVPPAQRPQANSAPAQTQVQPQAAAVAGPTSVAQEAVSAVAGEVVVHADTHSASGTSAAIKIIVSLVVLLLLGGGAFLGWQYFALAPIDDDEDGVLVGDRDHVFDPEPLSDNAIARERAQARDSARASDYAMLRTALELYFDTEKNYPVSLDALVPIYSELLPRDPVTNSVYAYSQTAGGTDYVLCLDFETNTPQCFTSGDSMGEEGVSDGNSATSATEEEGTGPAVF